MQESTRALVVILVLSVPVFWFARKALEGTTTAPQDFRRRRNLWFAVTLLAFLSPSYWMFIGVAAVMLLFARSREENALAMFLSLMFVVPQIAGRIGGAGIVNYLFAIDFQRVLSLAVLLPAFFVLRRREGTLPFGSTLADKLLVCFLILQFLVRMRTTTVTDAMRSGVFYAFTDAFLPYYVASRQTLTIRQLRDAMAAFVLLALLLAIIACFERLRHWLLYFALDDSLAGAAQWSWNYLGRSGGVRAAATAGQPIALGIVLLIGIAFLLSLKPLVRSSMLWRGALALLCAGLWSTVSRGPWVGAMVMVFVFLATGPAASKNLVKAGLAAGLIMAILMITPAGQKVIDLIPFVGNVEPHNAEYRREFMRQSMIVIQRHPWLGHADYMMAPEYDNLKPNGFLDRLNVFIAITLESGLVGLALFGGMFLSVGLAMLRAVRSRRGSNDELHLLGRSLLAGFAGLVVTINTVSPITIIPLTWWLMLGLGTAYVQLVRRGEIVPAAKAHPRVRAGRRAPMPVPVHR